MNKLDLGKALVDVMTEVMRNTHRPYPNDPLRRVALVGEEFGEALKDALDLTRPSAPLNGKAEIRHHLMVELTHTAAVATRALAEMICEDNDGDVEG